MEIRPDLTQESQLLNRLVQFAAAFDHNNIEHWPHLKNREDFTTVYSLPREQRAPLEEIYGTGRDLAVFMSGRLIAFNDSRSFPTLRSFVASFAGGWIDEIDILKEVSRVAKEAAGKLDSPPWAAQEMIRLFDQQIELLEATRQTIRGLKQSTTYQWESGTTPAVSPANAYDQILRCINMTGKMFERHPSVYANKEEEHLRDHILITLGGSIQWSATGETFNKQGKTDILARSATGDTEFVGECKFWRGEAVYHATIDQLLKYLGWRDNKAGVILFVQNKDFTAVLETIRACTGTHPNFVRFVSETDQSWLNFEFKLTGDPRRVIQVAVMAYHIPPLS
jgi:hypothetical protein